MNKRELKEAPTYLVSVSIENPSKDNKPRAVLLCIFDTVEASSQSATNLYVKRLLEMLYRLREKSFKSVKSLLEFLTVENLYDILLRLCSFILLLFYPFTSLYYPTTSCVIPSNIPWLSNKTHSLTSDKKDDICRHRENPRVLTIKV